MSITLTVVLILLAVAVTLYSQGAPIWNEEKVKNPWKRLTSSGKILALSLLISLVSISNSLVDHFESVVKEKNEIEHFGDTRHIGNCVVEIDEKGEKTYLITLDITDSLSKVNVSTLKLVEAYNHAFAEHQKAISKLDKLTQKINTVAEDSKAKLADNAPSIFLAASPRLVKKRDDEYGIEIVLVNNKSREAEVDLKIYLFQTDENGKSIRQPLVQEEKFTFPGLVKIPNLAFSLKGEMNSINSHLYCAIKCRYKDAVTEVTKELFEGMRWSGFETDSVFFTINTENANKAINLLKEHNLN